MNSKRRRKYSRKKVRVNVLFARVFLLGNAKLIYHLAGGKVALF